MKSHQSVCDCAVDLTDAICTYTPEQLVLMASILSLAISKGRDADELNVIGNFIVGVGGLLLAMAAQMDLCEPDGTKNLEEQLESLRLQIQDLKETLLSS